MKKLVMVLISAFMVSSIALAQNRQQMSAEEMASKQTDRMSECLSLSNDQKSKIKALNLKYAKKHQETRQQNKAVREAKRAEMQKLQEQKDAELKTILTDEQFKQYKEKEKKGKKPNRDKSKSKKQKGEKRRNTN